ncbi:MAG: TIGR02217 family protein [Allosphingosinicella sp.]
MHHWLAPPGAARQTDFVKRFDPRFWTVDFPRPMMASVVTRAPDALRVDAVFYKADDLAGLIWASEDRFDHPLGAYETNRDYRSCRLSFRWRSGGVLPLDAVNGPTLTVEGRDEGGAARSWFVRLWNYAEGVPVDAAVTLDFASLGAGWEGGEPVWAGDVDRMFVSLVPPGFSGADAALAAPAEGWAELSAMRCDGSGSVLGIGDVLVPEHRLRIATGYDDLYNLTPERVLRAIAWLGYRGTISHYVGMSHYPRLEANGGGFYASLAGGVLNGPCAAWHRDFAARAKAMGYALILSLSYELLDRHCWGDWKQRAADGSPALTGWDPPSTLLSPAHDGAMGYLRQVAATFAAIAAEAGLRVRFQVGEPWWWVTADGRICLYDPAAAARLAPAPIADVRAPLDGAQLATLDAAGALLAETTAALGAAVRGVAADAELLLLAYLPGVLAGEVRRANLPLGWGAPAFDRIQLEDYEWVTSGARGRTAAAAAEVAERLGYPAAEQHYFAGFVRAAADKAQWAEIAAAAAAARARGTGEGFVWALPQVLRDGFTAFEIGEEDMDAFDDVRFPIAVGREALVEPAFSTQVVTTASGAEQRNSDWADARLRFDAGPGIRGEAELKALLAFFRARRGAAIGFRFQDPFDHDCEAEPLGTGDGARTEFPLVKRYGEQVRRITRPVAGTVRLSVDGEERASGWTLAEKGLVRFDAPPAAGAPVTASFTFDVPVRFAEDRLSFGRATFAAGEAASVPLIEIRE